MLRHDRLSTLRGDIIQNRLHFCIRVLHEMVHRNNSWHTELLDVFNVASKVGTALLYRIHIFRIQILLNHAAIHLHRPNGRDNHDRRRFQSSFAALDVQEFLGPQIGPETRFRHNIVGQLQRGRRRDYRVTAMRDVRKRAAMHKGRIVFQSLHKVRLHRIFQQHRHRAIGLDVARKNRRAIPAIGHDHIPKSLLQILQVFRKTEDRHHFRRHRNVKPAFARKSISDAAQRQGHLTQCTVIHVDNAAPGHTTQINFLLIAPINVIVDHRRQKRMGRGNGMEITGKMKVHILHWNNLRITAARSPAFHSKIWPK